MWTSSYLTSDGGLVLVHSPPVSSQLRRLVKGQVAVVAPVQHDRVSLVTVDLVLHQRRLVLVPRVALVAEERQLPSEIITNKQFE